MGGALERTERLGRYEETSIGETVRAFIPPPLPPRPPMDMAPFSALLERATQALGRLDGIASILPDTPLFLYMYVRKEALLSSQIEGTQSSLSDLLLFESEEAPGVPLDDVREVSNYVRAMTHGLTRLQGGFPLSLRLIREIHALLMDGGRGRDKEPGEFRRSQNWIGGTRPGNAAYVPPPPHRVMALMGDLETFLHADAPGLSTLVKAGLAHVQFETIHPFLDGNGRLGRLLITLLLCERGMLKQPVLYLSLYLKAHRRRYYELLQDVRETGDWESWLAFFLEGVQVTADQAAATAGTILGLFERDAARLRELGRGAASPIRVHQMLQSTPLVRIPQVSARLNISAPTAAKALQTLADLGIVEEVSGRKRGRIYTYDRYLAILNDGTDPLPG